MSVRLTWTRNKRLAVGQEAIIRVLLLGVAAGGGLPQWNCACAHCAQARSGVIAAQTQSSVAVGDSTGSWFLVNASPDLPFHLRTRSELAPHPGSPRNSPIAGVFLTSADVDHVLGVLCLREGQTLPIYTSPAIAQTAALMGVNAVLQAFCGVAWHHPGTEFIALPGSSLRVRVLPLSDHAPRYCRGREKKGTGVRPSSGAASADMAYAIDSPGAQSHSHLAAPGDGRTPPAREKSGADAFTIALQFIDDKTGGRLLVAPGVGVLTDELKQAAAESDAVLLDGTFWKSDELSRVRAGAGSAAEMGHLPIKDGTLPFMKSLPSRHRIYMHINNTNPIFAPGSAERAEVESSGVVVGHDGLCFDL